MFLNTSIYKNSDLIVKEIARNESMGFKTIIIPVKSDLSNLYDYKDLINRKSGEKLNNINKYYWISGGEHRFLRLVDVKKENGVLQIKSYNVVSGELEEHESKIE